MAAIRKYHRMGGLNNRDLFSHNSGNWTSKIKMLAGLVNLEASLLALQIVTLFSQNLFSACISLVSLGVSKFFVFIRTLAYWIRVHLYDLI